LQENRRPYPVFGRAATIYETVPKVENDPVRLSIRRLALKEVLIALALSSAGVALARQSPQQPATSKTTPAAEDRVDINTASLDQLSRVPGMTHTWAARIIRFRPYRAKNELLDRGIVSSSVYDRIKDYIVAHRPVQ